MKRVTLLADDVREVPHNYRHLLLPGSGMVHAVHARHILAIEDADGRDFAPLDPDTLATIADLRVKLRAAMDRANAVVAPIREVMAQLAEPVEVESGPVQDEAPRMLTADELVALPVGSVVDATVTGARVRAMMTETGEWVMSFYLNGSRVAMPRELKDAILVPTPPIQPAPVTPLPLPTEPGARFWGKTSDTESQWWFARHYPHGSAALWYTPARASTLLAADVRFDRAASRGLVRLPDPSSGEVTA